MQLTTEQQHAIKAGQATLRALRLMILDQIAGLTADEYDQVKDVADKLAVANNALMILL